MRGFFLFYFCKVLANHGWKIFLKIKINKFHEFSQLKSFSQKFNKELCSNLVEVTLPLISDSHSVTTFFKDLQRAFGPNERSYLESQLYRYKRVVGAELSERIVYSLG